MEVHQQVTLSGTKGPEGLSPGVAQVSLTNSLRMSSTCSCFNVGSAPKALNAVITTASFENMNLSEAQKELVRWHNCLSRVSCKRIQGLMR